MEITQNQKQQFLTAAELLEKGDFAVIKKIVEFDETVKDQIEKTNEVIERAEEAIENLRQPEDGKDADEEAIEARITEKVEAQIPKKEEIIKEVQSKIVPTVVERVIEHTETIKEQPVITKETTEVQVLDEKKLEESLPKYGEQIRDSLELLKDDDRLDKSAIKGLEEEIKNLRLLISNIPRGGGGGGTKHSAKFYDLSSQTDGVTKVFTVPKSVGAVAFISDFPSVLMEGNGFTLNATRTQLTLTVANAPSEGSQLLYQYTEVFNT